MNLSLTSRTCDAGAHDRCAPMQLMRIYVGDDGSRRVGR